jgi:hypothetical protein
MTPSRKPAQSEGGGFPQWLLELGIRPGGFYIETKARLVHAMTNREWQDEPRVWACLALHTMAFQQELAVRMDKGALVPLRQIDIAKETGIDVRHVQRAVRNLEKQGSLQRQGETKGEVKLLCYAVPHRPKKDDVEAADAPEQGSIYDGLPDELAVWLRKFKFGAPDQEKLNEALQEAREVALHVERLRALSKSGDSVNRVMVTKSTESHSRAPEKDAARGVQKSEMHAARQPKSTPRDDLHIRKKELKERTAAAEVPADYRKAAAAIRTKFPQANAALVKKLTESCQRVLNGRLTDEILAKAVSTAYVSTQRSAGLFLNTVPEVLAHWIETEDPILSPPKLYRLSPPTNTLAIREAEKKNREQIDEMLKELDRRELEGRK